MSYKCSFYQLLSQLSPFHPPSPALLPTSPETFPDVHHPLLIYHPSYSLTYSSTETLQLGPYSKLCSVRQYYWFTSACPWSSWRWVVSACLLLHLPRWEGWGEGERRHVSTRDQLKPDLLPMALLPVPDSKRWPQSGDGLLDCVEAGFVLTASRGAGEGG